MESFKEFPPRMKPCTDNWAMEGLQKEMVELKAAFGTFY
jgi:hypothetical protein